MKKMNTYRVYGRNDFENHDEYIIVSTAQEAADTFRRWYPDCEVLEVARVLNNWN